MPINPEDLMELHGRTQDPDTPETPTVVMGLVCTVEAEVVRTVPEPEIEES